MKYLKRIFYSTLAGAAYGALMCICISFMSWSTDAMIALLPCIKVGGAGGFTLGFLYQSAMWLINRRT